ncbi:MULTISPECIES: hypothetical protein [unclassified Curtobacterium]|uniref:hypothetical protein n=1 Tax=unclassified Curtobacterium TaxID=257496 RepID=UPI0015E8A41A|nr:MULTISPECIES: hypothetical protein [unclassified Curtobacterium]
MSNSSARGTKYAGDDKERPERPLTVQEQARAMRREGLHDHLELPGHHRAKGFQ